MNADNEYINALTHFYEKSLILHDTWLFNETLYFYFIDAIAHIDYTCSIYAFDCRSPKNIMGADSLRWRIDEEKNGGTVYSILAWLKRLPGGKCPPWPHFGGCLYDFGRSRRDTEVSLSSLKNRIADRRIPANFFIAVIDEFFEQICLKKPV